MSIRLYVGNLPKDLDRQELAAVFAEVGDFASTKVITDRKTGKCRGFGFVTVQTDEQADQVIEQFNGYMFKDSPLKIEKALPRSKGKGDEFPSANPQASNAGGGSAPSPGRRNNNKGGNKTRRTATGGTTSTDSEGVQPDPRWAQELEKLKQLLAAQATN